MGAKCHLTEPMLKLFNSMLEPYNKRLEDAAKTPGLNSSDYKAKSFVDSCVAEYIVIFNDDFETIPYSEPPNAKIKQAEFWGKVHR